MIKMIKIVKIMKIVQVAEYATKEIDIEEDEIVDTTKNDPDYWSKLLGDVVNDKELESVTSEFGKGKRIRKKITYYDVDIKDISGDSDSSFMSESEESSEEDHIEIENQQKMNQESLDLNKVNNQQRIIDLKWKILNGRTIKLINLALFRYGLPPVSYSEMKNRWCSIGLKTKPENVVRGYIQALIEYLFSPYSKINLNQNIQEYDFRDINKEHLMNRLALMDLMRDKVYEYMRFSPYLYPILVSEGLVPINKLIYKFPQDVRLKRNVQNKVGNIEQYNLVLSSKEYFYPTSVLELEELGYQLHFNIEDGGSTDIHFVWNAEEVQKHANIWWRYHDMWLILGTVVHGFGRLGDIFDDSRFQVLNKPFQNRILYKF